VGIAHLILAQATALELVDQMPARQTMIDHSWGATQCARAERHDREG